MDKNTFTEKILENEDMLYRISMSMLKNQTDCEDAVQDTILAAYSKLNTLKYEEYFRTWLVRILINNCNKLLRQRGRVISDSNLPEAVVDSAEISTEVRLALDSLNPKIRIVVVMKYIEGFSVKEIKQILRIPEGTVKSRLSEGRKKLGIELADRHRTAPISAQKIELL